MPRNKTYVLKSDENAHAPTAVREATEHWSGGDKASAIERMVDWYGAVPHDTVIRLVSGKVPHIVRGDDVQFEDSDQS